MSDGQQLITTTTPSGETALNEPFSELAQLKRIIALLQNDIKEKDARLRGVHALTKICQDLGEKGSHWESKAKNYETCLKRAEARIAQLNKMLGIGPQTAFNRGVMFPGVSRKDFELVTQENIKLKKSLDHIVATDLGGHDVIMKNRELYELVSVLREDLSQSGNHIKELESALRSDENGVNGRVPELTRKLMKLERSLKAKQVFCEALIKENERLKKSVDEGSSSDNQEPSQDFTDARNKEENSQRVDDPALIEKMNSLGAEIEVMKKHIEERDEIISDFSRKLEVLETENEKLTGNASDLETAFKIKEQEYQQKLNAAKDQLTKKCADLQKKCDGFFKQVVSLNSKQQESETEVDRVKRAFEHQTAELEEKKSMIHLMTESLKSYEDDFHRESEEKAKIQKMLDKAQQETERTKRENQSHMATIQHLEDEFERMNKLLNEERKRGNDMRNKGIDVPAMIEKMNSLGTEIKVMKKHIEERDEIISDFSRKLEVLETENEKLTGNASEFEEAFKSKEQEYQQKLNAEKDQLTRKCADLQKKCDGFFKQVVSLYAKQQESETEVDQVKRAFEHQTAELEEKKSMIHLLTESLKSYEDDFRRESEGKAKIQKVLGKAQREHERKNQSHMATIQHLQDEFERMNKLLNEERKRRNDMRSKGNHFGTPAHNQAFAASGPRSLFLGNHFGMPAHNQAFAASGTRSLFLEHRPIQVVDDDSGGGFYVAEGNRKQNQHSMPTTKSEGSNAPSLVECPYCSRSYPYHLIEGHVQDCMEDSLYVDDRD